MYDSSGSASDNENVSWNNQTGAPEVVSLEVYGWNGTAAPCNTYDLDVTLAPSVVCGNDDPFEDNDFCGQHAVVATPFNQTGLYVEIGDADFFELTLPDQMQLDVACLFSHAIADIDVFIYDINSTCATNTQFLAAGQSATDDEILSFANTTGGPMSIAVKMEVWSGSQGFCNNYDLDLTVGPIAGACAGAPDDGFEENDDCTTAALIGDGLYPGLKVTLPDPDYYTFDVADGDTLQVDAIFLHADADIELFLYDLSSGCGSQMSPNVTQSTSGTNNESISWTNASGSTQTLILEVSLYVFSSGSCAYYDLDVSGTQAPVYGTPFCTPNPNSSGAAATMSASPAPVVGDPNLVLSAIDLPQNSFGFFLMSAMTAPGANVSNGVLCLGGQIFRYQQTIQNSGSLGEVHMPMPWTNLPAPIGAGETWHFQYWFRDSVGGAAVSNFSEGLTLDFN